LQVEVAGHAPEVVVPESVVPESAAVLPPSITVHVATHWPARPTFCFVMAGSVSIPPSADPNASGPLGIPVSHTYPLGQGTPPTMQFVEQYPVFEVALEKQKQAPVVASDVAPVPPVHAAPTAFVRLTRVFVQKPMSAWQT
jgi:hypothetical protein